MIGNYYYGTGRRKSSVARVFLKAGRITSYNVCYTKLLRVVAAIRGVTTGGYLAQIREYEKREIRPELDHLRKSLITLTDGFEKSVAGVLSAGSNEMTDFHARRLVERNNFV